MQVQASPHSALNFKSNNKYTYFNKGSNDSSQNINQKYCTNHPEKKAKYVEVSDSQDGDLQHYYCSKCAIESVLQEKKIQELVNETVNPLNLTTTNVLSPKDKFLAQQQLLNTPNPHHHPTKSQNLSQTSQSNLQIKKQSILSSTSSSGEEEMRKAELTVFLEKLKLVSVENGSLKQQLILQQSEFIKQYEEQSQSIEKMADEVIEIIKLEKQMQMQKTQDLIASTKLVYQELEKLVDFNSEQMQFIQNDINQNLDKILRKMEHKPFDMILNKYEQKLQGFKNCNNDLMGQKLDVEKMKYCQNQQQIEKINTLIKPILKDLFSLSKESVAIINQQQISNNTLEGSNSKMDVNEDNTIVVQQLQQQQPSSQQLQQQQSQQQLINQNQNMKQKNSSIYISFENKEMFENAIKQQQQLQQQQNQPNNKSNGSQKQLKKDNSVILENVNDGLQLSNEKEQQNNNQHQLNSHSNNNSSDFQLQPPFQHEKKQSSSKLAPPFKFLLQNNNNNNNTKKQNQNQQQSYKNNIISSLKNQQQKSTTTAISSFGVSPNSQQFKSNSIVQNNNINGSGNSRSNSMMGSPQQFSLTNQLINILQNIEQKSNKSIINQSNQHINNNNNHHNSNNNNNINVYQINQKIIKNQLRASKSSNNILELTNQATSSNAQTQNKKKSKHHYTNQNQNQNQNTNSNNSNKILFNNHSKSNSNKENLLIGANNNHPFNNNPQKNITVKPFVSPPSNKAAHNQLLTNKHHIKLNINNEPTIEDTPSGNKKLNIGGTTLTFNNHQSQQQSQSTTNSQQLSKFHKFNQEKKQNKNQQQINNFFKQIENLNNNNSNANQQKQQIQSEQFQPKNYCSPTNAAKFTSINANSNNKNNTSDINNAYQKNLFCSPHFKDFYYQQNNNHQYQNNQDDIDEEVVME